MRRTLAIARLIGSVTLMCSMAGTLIPRNACEKNFHTFVQFAKQTSIEILDV